MRVVLDTNALVSGILFPLGPPRRLVDAVRAGTWQLCLSEVLLAELLDVLSRRKFAERIARADLTVARIVSEIRDLALLVAPPVMPPTVIGDPDDDHVLACAIGAGAELIVSGDRDLLALRQFHGIAIVPPSEAAALLGS